MKSSGGIEGEVERIGSLRAPKTLFGSPSRGRGADCSEASRYNVMETPLVVISVPLNRCFQMSCHQSDGGVDMEHPGITQSRWMTGKGRGERQHAMSERD